MSGPACWIRSAGFRIDPGTLLANGDCRSVMSLNGCHELDAAVAVPVVVPRADSKSVTSLLAGAVSMG